jgi:hypothetical protein
MGLIGLVMLIAAGILLIHFDRRDRCKPPGEALLRYSG